MKKTSKWLKWQIGAVVIVLLVFLLQEVKDSPEFQKAQQQMAQSSQKATDKQPLYAESNRMPSTQGMSNNNRFTKDGKRRGMQQRGSFGSSSGSSSIERNNGADSIPESGSSSLQPHSRTQAS